MNDAIKRVSMAGAAAVAAACLVGSAAAQGLPPAPAEMGALGWLEGAWEGEGWIDHGGHRAEFRGTERVEQRMGGRLLVVEGSFTAFMGPQLGEVLVHQAFGVFSWKEKAGEFVFRTYTARGGDGDANAVEVSPGRLVWGYEGPTGKVRYTITRTAEGEWREEGHASRDGGETWALFFEMVLTRR